MSLRRLLNWLAALLVLKVTIVVVLKYRDYLPPNFDSDFLQGRESYFFDSYQWAFYPHIAAGPLTLILGLLLINDRVRLRFPKAHRVMGRVQILLVLFVVAPSGFWMAYRAAAGPAAGLGFGLLAFATGLFAFLGWRTAVRRRFAEHRRWMERCFAALCSTVVLRLIAGLANVARVDAAWVDVFAAWGSWLLPLAAFELFRVVRVQSLIQSCVVPRSERASDSDQCSTIPALHPHPGGTSTERNDRLGLRSPPGYRPIHR